MVNELWYILYLRLWCVNCFLISILLNLWYAKTISTVGSLSLLLFKLFNPFLLSPHKSLILLQILGFSLLFITRLLIRIFLWRGLILKLWQSFFAIASSSRFRNHILWWVLLWSHLLWFENLDDAAAAIKWLFFNMI